MKMISNMEKIISQSQKQWMSIFDAITDYIFVVGNDYKLVKVNRIFASSFDMHPKDLIGEKCYEMFGLDTPCANCIRDRVINSGSSNIEEKTLKNEEIYQISVFPLYDEENNSVLTVHLMKNITEMKRLKDRLYYSDKLASIGLLVSGVAHEINNPLTGIIAYTELLKMKVSDEGVGKDLKKILDSADRCKKIIENLLTFSRQRTPSKSLESINDIIDRALDLRSYWLKSSNIDIVREYSVVPTVVVDSQQIQQVLLNILLNAEQAISASNKREGRIVFHTEFDESNQKIMIRISDNGHGIPQEIIPKVFDPFFTTKPVGIGTGLGLSISHGIITEHGGSISVESSDDMGTTLVVELPTGKNSALAT